MRRLTHRLDGVLLHPWLGPLILFALLFVMFQAVFAWATILADALEAGIVALGTDDRRCDARRRAALAHRRRAVRGGRLGGRVPAADRDPVRCSSWSIEATGYMVRAAFLMDRLMSHVGLSGRSFIPLLSSFACAVPGIMATRTIDDPKDRLTTILVAPLMTCSARLPVYTLIIGAFIPARSVGSGIGLQGLVLFALYVVGIVGALARRDRHSPHRGEGRRRAFMMELPKYQMPRLTDLAIGLWQRAAIFLQARRRHHPRHHAGPVGAAELPRRRAGPKAVRSLDRREDRRRRSTSSSRRSASTRHQPRADPGDGGARGRGRGDRHDLFGRRRRRRRRAVAVRPDRRPLEPATALAFLAWFVFAPQCISTIAVTRRETNGWKWPLFMLTYLFVLAYLAAGATYWTAVAFGLG